MRHLVAGRKLKRTHSHRKALLSNLATQLFEHKKVHTTEAKAKELRPFAEKLISKAKNALLKERQGLLPDGNTVDVHNRRTVAKLIRSKAVLQELFDVIAPAVETRNGGFTRIIKTGVRRGDNARTALIHLVDFANPQDGASSSKRKRKPVQAKKPVESAPKTEVKAAQENVAPVVADTPVVADEPTKMVFDDTATTPAIAEDSADNASNDSSKMVFDDTLIEKNDSVDEEKKEVN